MNTEIKEVSMTDKEKRSIRSERNIITGFIIIITVIANSILLYVKKNEGGDFNNAILISSIMTVVIFTFAVFIFIYKSRDLKSDTKFIINGIITDKGVTHGKGANCMIYVNGERIFVLHDEYKKLLKGDEVEVHYTTRSKKSLYISSKNIQDSEALRNNRHYRRKQKEKAGKKK